MTVEPTVLPLTEVLREFDMNAAPRRRRRIAPGEAELGLATLLQVFAAGVLTFASPLYLAGNGTALLTMSNRPDLSPYIKAVWALVFIAAGGVGIYALKAGTPEARKLAWQVIIPLWVLWLSGLTFPVVVGLPTNLIVLGAVGVLVIQWFVIRILVPADSDWYSREVTVGRHLGEGR